MVYEYDYDDAEDSSEGSDEDDGVEWEGWDEGDSTAMSVDYMSWEAD